MILYPPQIFALLLAILFGFDFLGSCQMVLRGPDTKPTGLELRCSGPSI